MSHPTPASPSSPPPALLRWIVVAALVGLLVGLIGGVAAITAAGLQPRDAAAHGALVVVPASRYELHAALRFQWTSGEAATAESVG